VNNFGPVKILNVLVKIKEFVTKESFVTVVVLKLLKKKVRRDRVGHINLVVPIAHIWYFRSLLIKLDTYLVFLQKLDMIIYYEIRSNQAGIAVNGEGESVQRLDFLTEKNI
jgi:DNA-directed RNA polymerase subunit beta'